MPRTTAATVAAATGVGRHTIHDSSPVTRVLPDSRSGAVTMKIGLKLECGMHPGVKRPHGGGFRAAFRHHRVLEDFRLEGVEKLRPVHLPRPGLGIDVLDRPSGEFIPRRNQLVELGDAKTLALPLYPVSQIERCALILAGQRSQPCRIFFGVDRAGVALETFYKRRLPVGRLVRRIAAPWRVA